MWGVAVMTEEVNLHIPVLLNEVIEGLSVKPEGIYIDGTFGRGGHSRAILEKMSEKGRLFAIDKDPDAVEMARQVFGSDPRFHIWHESFSEVGSLTREVNIYGKVDGILLDLGVSSPQLEDPERGFSFLKEGPLDMRMDTQKGVDAATWLSKVREKDLAWVLKTYGEERHARRIASEIVRARKKSPILTTKRLADVIVNMNLWREKHKHPATRSFQAIRIFINQELDELQKFLEQCLEVLADKGRLVIISFHSLEDLMIKRFIKKSGQGTDLLPYLPIREKESFPRLKQVGRAIKPGAMELKNNPRARSAVLRIAEKIV